MGVRGPSRRGMGDQGQLDLLAPQIFALTAAPRPAMLNKRLLQLGSSMARRNLASRADIPADVLRQRRDLYALAIGLMLFYLADGSLEKGANVGSLFSLQLGRPGYVLVAAWIGFFYFWMRFWLVTEAKPIGDYIDDVRWQAGDSRTIRSIAAQYVTATEQGSEGTNRKRILDPKGHVPLVRWQGMTPILSLNDVWPRSPARGGVGGVNAGPPHTAIPRKDRLRVLWVWLRAFPNAAVRERAFTDYTLPHLFALATLVIALVIST